jgi:plasmid stabilization system protein ParE
MSYTLEIKEEARQDVLQAAQWHEEQQEGLGQRFWESTWANLKYLENYPLSQQRKYQENRELLMKDFPYVIVYRIAERNTVIVLAIASCKQHPSKKRKRA